ncbi:hypothetical protein IAE22_28270 [Bacillus sp. S34]|nr:hypothetical protein [Bacillus sp. S34]
MARSFALRVTTGTLRAPGRFPQGDEFATGSERRVDRALRGLERRVRPAGAAVTVELDPEAVDGEKVLRLLEQIVPAAD